MFNRTFPKTGRATLIARWNKPVQTVCVAVCVALCVALLILTAGAVAIEPSVPAAESKFVVPAGWEVQKVAGQPLVNYPLFACFDDQGRLYVAEGTGKNLPGTELVKLKLGKITRLEDTDGDGVFDQGTTFADGLIFPQGVLWYEGAVYVASHPAIWRLEDTDGDGRADKQEQLVSKFGFNGNGCDIHGPFLGPDGWLYWTDGRHGHECETREGEKLQGLAARIFRCRPDGTNIERIAGGGFDNPVELIWTDGGELLGTMDQGPGDCILHYVEGGVYPRDDQPCMKEFAMTGPPLPPVTMFSAALPVALCGMCPITTDQFGSEHRGTLLTAQFNVHRIQQHILTRDGSTYRAANKDFLVSTDYDFHPSDVLEDADGSLLIVDMGAWFNYGCPTAKIAKPEVKGTIYRVRNGRAPRRNDAWGKSIRWSDLDSARLNSMVVDSRPVVRARALRELSDRGELAKWSGGGSASDRLNRVWGLCRHGGDGSMAAIRSAVSDEDPSVRMAALHAIGLLRDQAALPILKSVVVQGEPPLRLKAAEAIGRIGDPGAIPALVASLHRGDYDRFLEHALIYAMIQINDRPATLPALANASPKVRRAGLIALDQMPDGKLTRELVTPLLDTDDPELQRAAVEVISRHEGWSSEIHRLLRQWLAARDRPLEVEQQRAAVGALLAFAGEVEVQQLVADTLADRKAPIAVRLLMPRVIARCRLERLPDSWNAALESVLAEGDVRLLTEVIAMIRARGLDRFDERLAELSRGDRLGADQRVSALAAIAPRRRLENDAFDYLLEQLAGDSDPLLQVTAARAIGSTTLDRPQLLRLAERMDQAGPMLMPLLLPAFTKSREAAVGGALVSALARAPGTAALSAEDLRTTLGQYSDEVQQAAHPLFAQVIARQEEQEAYLSKLTLATLQMPPVPQRGRDVFFSKKVGCYGCHKIDGQGGSVGPDLSQIGRIRDPRTLLEAIVFPSSTIVPDYRQFVVASHSGTVHTGMIVREDVDGIYLRTAELSEIRIPRGDVAAVKESAASIMPQGLERTMSAQELSDLLEYLYQHR